MDLFQWTPTAIIPVQGPPEPDVIVLKVKGSLQLQRHKTGWGTPGLVVESFDGHRVHLGHAATWHNFGHDDEDMGLSREQMDTVQEWCAELDHPEWFWTESDRQQLNADMGVDSQWYD